MSSLNRLLWVGLLGVGVGISAATTAQAGVQLFEAAWTVKAFGNECSAADKNPGPHCPQSAKSATGPSEFIEYYGIPQELMCNHYQPRCPFESTPYNFTVSMMGKQGPHYFAPLGGSRGQPLHCEPWANWGGNNTTVRPAKGASAMDANGRPVPPLYRNPAFFTPSGGPYLLGCNGRGTDGFGGPGPVQLGNPVTGMWSATTTGNQRGGFNFAAAPTAVPTVYLKGVRATGVIGEFEAIYPYLYSYTYATVRNDAGVFGPERGPGAKTLNYGNGNATIIIKEGGARFGGTMRMLGALTTKVCYYRAGGCSLGQNNWRYDAIGDEANVTANGALISGYEALYEAVYYHTALMQKSTIMVEGERFPWTTGSVSVLATGRGPHKTIAYAHGYDNRNTTTPNGMGTIQLVTPVLTRWNQPTVNFETGGIGILRIKFLPEPQAWVMLVAGISLLGVVKRVRGH